MKKYKVDNKAHSKSNSKIQPLSSIDKTLNKKQPQEIEDKGETYSPKFQKDPIGWALFDAVAFSGLILSSDTLLSLPAQTLRHGGYYLMVVFFIFSLCVCFPLLHLELFVSQYLKSGILKAIQLYGKAYKGFGVGIVILTILHQHVFIHRGSYILGHLMSLPTNLSDAVSCSSVYNVSLCESLYDDRRCGPKRYFEDGKCVATKTMSTSRPKSAAESYIGNFARSQKDVSYKTIIIQYSMLFACSLPGEKFLVFILFGIGVVTFLSVGIGAANLPKLAKLHDALRTASNPAALFTAETYLVAFRAAILTYGLCTRGLFCASSFRSRVSRSHQQARFIFWWLMIIYVLSVFFAVSVLFGLEDASHTSTTISTKTRGVRFAIAAMTEYVVLETRSPKLYLVLYHILIYLIDFSSALGAIFTIMALIRDFIPRYRGTERALALIIYYSLSITYYVTFSSKFSTIDEAMESSMIAFTMYFFIALMIVIFVHAYGEHEFEIDVVTVLGERSGILSFLNATKNLYSYRYSLILLIVVQTVECSRILDGVWFSHYLYEEESNVEVQTTFLSAIIHALPVLACLVVCCFQFARIRTTVPEMFRIAEQHTSFTRVTGKIAAEEMVGENLLDKTPPESERPTTSKETKDTGGTGQSGSTDEPEITAPPHTDPSEKKLDEIHTQATVSVPRTPAKQEPITAPTPKTPASVP